MNDYDINKTAMMPNPIRIAVFDDHPMFHEGMVQMLKRVDGFEIVGEGVTATDAFKIARERAPDVILLDLCIPGGGIEAAACIARDCPNVFGPRPMVSECEQDVASAAIRIFAESATLRGSATD
jgi:two-component system, NarL family, nitrate/nitrite response regulator NarL